MNKALRLFSGVAVASLLVSGTAAAEEVLFWSNQAQPVEEAQSIRQHVLADFPGGANFQPADPGPWLTRIEAELKANSGTIDVLGSLHGRLISLTNDLIDLSDVDVGGVQVNTKFMELGKLGTNQQKYLPWMQATYIMAANKKALPYLPKGVDLDNITYDQLLAWCKNMTEQTGSPKFGFPAGPEGLRHRFFEGYLLPSFTGSMVTKFRSAEAEAAWKMFNDLWKHTNPSSTTYAFMERPLMSGEVWVAFDHVVRLSHAFNEQPDDFVAFPAPSGPAGRGFMPVVAGLAIPRTVTDVKAAKNLVAYMLQPAAQIATLRATNFFPVIAVDLPEDMPNSVRASGAAVAKMTSAPDALPALLPVGLGDLGGRFNQVYVDTFERIVLNGQDPRAVLDDQAKTLRNLMNQAKAPCWPPDEPSKGTCPVD